MNGALVSRILEDGCLLRLFEASAQTFPCDLEGFGEHARFRHRCHEVGVPQPTG